MSLSFASMAMFSHLRPRPSQPATIQPSLLEITEKVDSPTACSGPPSTDIDAFVPRSRFYPLRRLPSELRFKIFQLCLFPDTDSYAVELGSFRVPPIMQAARGIRAECLPIYNRQVSAHAFVTMDHSYGDAIYPSHGYKKLNRPASILGLASPPYFRAPLASPAFRRVTLSISDADQCRLWSIKFVADREKGVSLTLTKLPSATTRLGMLEINAIERLPSHWKMPIQTILGTPGFNGFTVSHIKALTSLINIRYCRHEIPTEELRADVGGDLIMGDAWTECITDKALTAMENFGKGGPDVDADLDDSTMEDAEVEAAIDTVPMAEHDDDLFDEADGTDADADAEDEGVTDDESQGDQGNQDRAEHNEYVVAPMASAGAPIYPAFSPSPFTLNVAIPATSIRLDLSSDVEMQFSV